MTPKDDPLSLPFSQVPSSQTQENHLSYSKSPPTSPSWKIPPLSNHLKFSTTGIPRSIYSTREAVDESQFVNSSQTQHMLPYHISPRRNRIAEPSSYLDLSPTDDCSGEVIPSSQSPMERELDISKDISEYLPKMADNTINAGALNDKLDDKESVT